MEESCKQAKCGVQQVQKTGEALTNIANKVSEIDIMAREIAKAAEEQDIG
jgi:methyl-accepting chemotaxis protein